MKIVNWNCAGAFRKKIEKIQSFNADVYIIQESEHPNKFLKESNLKDYHYFWKGDNENKGIAVYYKPNIIINEIVVNETYRDRQLKWFLPLRINNEFDLIAVWTHKAESVAFQYIGQFYWFLQNNINKFKKPIFIGDFNSNTMWDSWDRWWNHSDIVKILDDDSIKSIYHLKMKEQQGKESIKTFFHRKNLEKGYHIDYIFSHSSHISKPIKLTFGKIEDWIDFSDHLPIIWEIKE